MKGNRFEVSENVAKMILDGEAIMRSEDVQKNG